MLETVRSPEQLSKDFTHLRLLFSVIEYVMTTVIPGLQEDEYMNLSVHEAINVPIQDPTIVCHLNGLGFDTDVAAIDSALSELAVELGMAFEINPNMLFEEDDPNCDEPPYLLSIVAVSSEKDIDDEMEKSEEMRSSAKTLAYIM